MGVNRSAIAVAILAIGSLPAAAHAQGFGLNEIGSCAITRGFAVTGAPCADGSYVYWNPAGGTLLKGTTLTVGGAGVQVKGNFTADFTQRRDNGNVPIVYPPHLFLNHRLNDRIALGVGVYVPYGLTSQWHDDFAGRFSAVKAALQSVYVQPNISIDVVPGKFSIGGGPIWARTDLELKQGVDLSQQIASISGTDTIRFARLGIAPGTEFARAELKGHATAYGFNLGAHAQLTPKLQAGARYLSKMTFDIDKATATFQSVATGLTLAQGNVIVPNNAPAPVDVILLPQFAPGGALTTRPVATKLNAPSQIQAGFGYDGYKNTLLSFDYAMIMWSQFKELPITFGGTAPAPPNRVLIEDYKNSWAIRGGADHKFDAGWFGRAGVSYTTAAAPDETVTPLLPDMNRINYSIGAGLPFGERYMLDAGFLRVSTSGRRGRLGDRPNRSLTAEQLNNGFFTLDANIFSFSLRASF